MASAYLSRSISTTGNRKTWTFSCWLKKNTTGDGYLLSANDASNYSTISFSGSQLRYYDYYSGAVQAELKTNRKFKDPNAWYHIVVRYDTTQSTADDRIRFYVNGVQETSIATRNNPGSQTWESYFNFSGDTNYINREGSSSTPMDCCMSHIHFCDGYSYDADTFGETDSTTGQWKIKTSPSVTYGTNGFFLFKDNASVSDQSGNSNDFTASGTLTPTEDCPSNVFATWNPIAFENAGGTRLSNGNTRADGESSAAHNLFVSTLAVSSGKWYFEAKLGAAGGDKPWIGIRDVDGSLALGQFVGQVADSLAYGNGQLRTNDSTLETGLATYTTGDIIGVALDLDSAQNKCYFYKNGTLVNSGGRNIDNKTYCFAVSQYQNTGHWLANFGNGYFGTTAITSEGTNASGIGKFEYDVPTGYTALSTKGLNE